MGLRVAWNIFITVYSYFQLQAIDVELNIIISSVVFTYTTFILNIIYVGTRIRSGLAESSGN